MEEQSFVPKPTLGGGGGLFNILTAVFLVLSCVSLLCVSVIFANPGVIPAALQPQSLPVTSTRVPTPTPTNTSLYPTFPPTWTPTTPTATFTREISDTHTPTVTTTAFKSRTPTRTPTKTRTLGPTPTRTPTRSSFQYTLQTGSPSYLANFANTA